MHKNRIAYALMMLIAWAGLSCFSCFCAQAHAGAWPLRLGEGHAVVSGAYLDANSVTDAHGDEHSYDISEAGFSTWGEIGMARSLAVGWSWTAVKSVSSDSFVEAGTCNPEISLSWHALTSGAFQFAVQGMVLAPIGPENPDDAPDFLYAVFSQQAWAFEIRPVVGWGQGGYWLQAGAGPRARTQDLTTQFHYNLAGGGKISRLGWMLAISGITPFQNASSGKPGDWEQFFGYNVAGEFRLSRAWQAGGQFDSMFTDGREMPLGGRFNLYVRFAFAPDRQNPDPAVP